MFKKKNKKKKRRPSRIHASTGPTLVSVCMIVRNEEKNLDACLRLVKGFADEIIVVDTGSTDRTVAIANRFGVNLQHYAWNDDFSAARNASLGYATGRWIIWIDADDRIFPDQHGKIRALASREPNTAYNFLLRNDGAEGSQCYQLRMFPNRPELRFERPVHEQVAASAVRAGLPVQSSDVVLIHVGYRSEKVVRAKKERYVAMMEKWLAVNPNDAAMRYQLGLAFHTMNLDVRAIPEFNHVLQRNREFQSDPAYFYSAILLGRSLLNQGRPKEALAALKKAEQLNSSSSFLQISLAEALLFLGETAQALEYLKMAKDSPDQEISYFPIDHSLLNYGRLVLLGKAQMDLGHMTDAKEHLVKAIQLKPDKPDAYKHHGEWLRSSGNYGEAIKAYRQAAEKDPANHYYDFQIGDIYLSLGWLAKARIHMSRALEKGSSHPALLLKLATVERDSGRFDASLDYFDRLLAGGHNQDNFEVEFCLCLADQGDVQALARRIAAARPNTHLQWLGYLIELFNDRYDGVRSAIRSHQTNLGEADDEEIADYLVESAEGDIAAGRLLMAELKMRAALFLAESRAVEIMVHLASIQSMNRRLFQAIETMEAVIQYSTGPEMTLKMLNGISQCYLQIGAEEAHRFCLEKIKKLEAESQTSV